MPNQCWQNSWWEPSPNSWDLTDYHDSGWKERCPVSKSQQSQSHSEDFCLPKRNGGPKAMKEDGRNDEYPCATTSFAKHSAKGKCDKDPTCYAVWGNSMQSTSSQKGNWGQSSSNSSWEPRVREDTVTGPTAHRDPGHTRPTCQGDPSIEFQTLSEKIKIWKVTSSRTCTHITVWETFFQNWDNFLLGEAIWSMFMNDCMWAVFYLSEEGENFKRFLGNHQSHKSQTIIETVQARLQDLTKRCRRILWNFILAKLANRILD